jgi:hypothetical protein
MQGLGQTAPNYDENISRIVKKIHQYPNRTKDLDALKENYDLATKADLDKIKVLRSSGQPDIWYEVYLTYARLDNRQKAVKTIPDKSFRLLGIETKDYRNDLDETRNKATAYLFAHASKLLQEPKPESAVVAYNELLKVAELNGKYPDLDKMFRKAVLIGATDVKFEMDNQTGKMISSAMVDRLSVITQEFKKARYSRVSVPAVDQSFAFMIRVVLDDMQIGPDQIKDLSYEEERDRYQGETVIDTIRCQIKETRQLKKAQLSGRLEYFDPRLNQVINSVPVKVEAIFSNAYATLQGDPAAAGDETKKLLNSKKAAYPTDEQMILKATEEFSDKAREIILAE